MAMGVCIWVERGGRGYFSFGLGFEERAGTGVVALDKKMVCLEASVTSSSLAF